MLRGTVVGNGTLVETLKRASLWQFHIFETLNDIIGKTCYRLCQCNS